MKKLLVRHEASIMFGVMIFAFVTVGSIVLNQLNAATMGWRTNFDKSSIPLEDIRNSGMGRDGIDPIDTPQIVRVSDTDTLTDRSPVISVEIGDAVRAYPLAVLMRHEIVNDTLNNQPIAVTFCPLCHSPIVYEREIDGQILRFGVSGNLYKSGIIMWDDVTESWWRQFTGEAVVGDYTGRMLEIVPSQVVSLAEYRKQYPQGEIVTGDVDKPDIVYGKNPYVGYDSQLQPFMFNETPDERYTATERVLAAVIATQPVAYPYSVLTQAYVINDRVADEPVVVFWLPGATSTLDKADIDLSRDVGMAMLFYRELDGQVLRFRYMDGFFYDDLTDSAWNIFGEAVSGDLAGAQLERIECSPNFWFAWAETYPDTLVYGSN